MQNYYLSLLAIYTRAIYLAYICRAASEPQIVNIPIMCCIMYVVPKSNPPEQPQFFLSSSWSGSNSVAENLLRQAVDPWRKKVLATCLRQIARTGEGMPKSLPVFEPLYLKELCRLFWKNFRGKGKQSNGKLIIPSIALAKVHEQSAARYLARYSDESRPTTIAFGEYFSPNSKVEPILMSLLADVIKAKFNAGPINTLEVEEALMAFFEFCCTPQFQFSGGQIVKMVAPPDNLHALWNKYHLELEELLQALFTAQKTQTIPPGRPFGRCAETYCFICMQ